MYIALVLASGLATPALLCCLSLAQFVLLPAGADQAVALERGHEHHAQAVDHFEVVHRGIPRVEQDRVGLDLLVAPGADQHLQEVLVLGLTVRLRGVDAEVNREEVVGLAARVQQVDHADAAHQAALGPAVLELDQLDLARILLVLHAVIHDEIAVGAVLKQRRDDFPEAAGRELLAAQVVADGVVTGRRLAFQVVG